LRRYSCNDLKKERGSEGLLRVNGATDIELVPVMPTAASLTNIFDSCSPRPETSGTSVITH